MVIRYELHYVVYYLSNSKAVACLLNQVLYLHVKNITYMTPCLYVTYKCPLQPSTDQINVSGGIITRIKLFL